MTIKYTLSVNSVNTANITQVVNNGVVTPVNYPDAVYSVNYTYSGTDGKNTASVSGVIGVGSPDPLTFMPTENVSNAKALEWALASFAPNDLECFQNSIQEQLTAKTAPVLNLGVVLTS